MDRREKVKIIIDRLLKVWPNPKTALENKNPYQLLIATILSAQATDISVNKAAPALFKTFPDPKDLAKANAEEIDKYIKNINFHSNKAKLIKKTAQMLVEKFKGNVPDNMKDLDLLPGVARKTANVVLSNGFGKEEGIVVDTHVIRLSNKLGLSVHKDPVKIEQDLMKVVPKGKWGDFAHLLINFGRIYCPARPHKCPDCPLKDLCPDK